MDLYEECPIWATPCDIEDSDYGNAFVVSSPRTGGKYRSVRRLKSVLGEIPEKQKALLTSLLIERRTLGDECPLIDEQVIEEAKNRRSMSISERFNRAFETLASGCDEIGEEIWLTNGNSDDMFYGNRFSKELLELALVSECISESEVHFLLDEMSSRGFLSTELSTPDGGFVCKITMKGYSYLESLQTEGVETAKAFVAMWFDESLNEAYRNGIRQGILDAGYEPVRIDSLQHNNKIDDEIIAEIRRCRFLVSDFTQGHAGARGGVYYEAGFAHGLNKPVIFTCREDAISDVHFDTRQYNHITWRTPEDLCSKLTARISATIGDGPLVKREGEI